MNAVCAISTPIAQGALSVIRISGEDAIETASRVFFRADGKEVSSMAGYTCAYGHIKDKSGAVIDDAVLTVFRAPRSYTGENTAEISCHGGIYITKKILRLCCENGARPAQRGEFTKLAFLNGKLSLTQAEAVMETISAQGELSLRSANLTRQGALFEKINAVRQRLITLLGSLAAWADYPEEDIPEVTPQAISLTLNNALETSQKLLNAYDNGLALKNGVPAVIAGKPNVGKSTLMNLLLGFERAIVTDIAGTTRDIIEETVRLGDITLRLSDTAGLRTSDEEVERIGILLAEKRIEESALIIAVFDGSAPPDEDDLKLIERLRGSDAKIISLINKTDIADQSFCEQYRRLAVGRIIEISAKTGDGRDALERAAAELFGAVGDDDSAIFVNERQKDRLECSAKYLKKAIAALNAGMTADAVTIDITQAADALSELIGERVTESVVDEVFSKFCVGK